MVPTVLTRVIDPVTVPLVFTTCGVKVTVSDADVMSATFPETAICEAETASPVKVSVRPLTVTLFQAAA